VLKTITIENKKYYLLTDADLYLTYDDPFFYNYYRRFDYSILKFYELDLTYKLIERMKEDNIEGLFFCTICTPNMLPERLTKRFILEPLRGEIKGYFGTLRETEMEKVLRRTRRIGLPIVLDNQKANKQAL